MHIHILGICGTFMGGLAALARETGHTVTGCDTGVYPPMSDQLRALGIDLVEGYGADQLALKPEASTWRNAYLQGAIEMRNGAPKQPMRAAGGGDSVKALRIEMIFDMLAIRVQPDKAEGQHLVINWHFTDTGDKVASNLENCVLSYRLDCERPDAGTQVRIKRSALVAVMTRQTSFADLAAQGELMVEGQRDALAGLFGTLDEFGTMFNIVEP